MRVISYHNGEEWMRGKVVAFVNDMAVVQNDANDFLATLNINSLKVIDEHCKNEKDLKSDNFTIQKVNEELMLKIFEKQNKGMEASARTAFKHAFNLLMPIIEKQMEALEAEWPGEYGAIIREHHDEALQETKKALAEIMREIE